MRYAINFDKQINRLVPHYIGGRKLILYLQALMKPLQELNDKFKEWAREMRIEASMTSQTFKFEWFLNRRFSKYFQNPSDRLVISSGTGNFGTPMYNEDTELVGIENVKLYGQNEEGVETAVFYRDGERTEERKYSFTVHSPAINTELISKEEYVSLLCYQIDKYKLAGKTYTIIFDNETL